LELNDTHLLVVSVDVVSLLADRLYVIKGEIKKERRKERKENKISIFVGR
jgi:general stress protein CsbA